MIKYYMPRPLLCCYHHLFPLSNIEKNCWEYSWCQEYSNKHAMRLVRMVFAGWVKLSGSNLTAESSTQELVTGSAGATFVFPK